MKTNWYPVKWIVMSLWVLLCANGQAQVSGLVFRDVNSNGMRDLVNPTEPGENGITVRAYNAVNTLLAAATTNALGNYNFSPAQIPSGTPVRLEFILPTGDYPAKRIAAARSNIQFVTGGVAAVNINFGLANKKLLSDNNNPYVATTAATNGDALATSGGNAPGRNNNLYVFPYDLSNDGGNSRRVENQYLGSIFGLTWQKESRTLLMAAYVKRHVGFGPNGMGAIYKVQIPTNGVPGTPSLLLDVTALGINIGPNPRTTALPTDSRGVSTDDGVFANVGKVGIGGMTLANNGRDLYFVNLFDKSLYRIDIGNPLKASFSSADVTGSWIIPDPLVPGTAWHPMAVSMHQGRLYVGGVSSAETTIAHNIADTANMRGIVYELNLATNTFTEVLRFPLSYRRGFGNADYRYEHRNNYWCAWQNNGDISIGGPLRSGLIGATTGNNATGIYYPQPMLSKITFDIDGSMIIGLRDRFGDQGGYLNLFETGNVSGEAYRTLSSGEILRAGKTASNSWTIENGGAVTSAGTTTTTLGLTPNNPPNTGSFSGMTGTPWGGTYGPGGRYYYYNQNFTTTGVPAPFNVGGTVTSHYVKSNGGVAILPGYNEVIMTGIDPVSRGFSNGVIKNFNLGGNAGNMSGRMELLFSAPNDPTNMGKACALGDIEILFDAQSVEIGNRVWQDLNGNGSQDAGEPGIAGLQVVLRSPGANGVYGNGDDQTWMVTTDANGHYYFDGSFVHDNRRPISWIGVSATNSGILPGFEYKVEINGSQPQLAGLVLSWIHNTTPQIDSDGSYNAINIEYVLNPGGSTAAASSFENNYDIDFGFMTSNYLALRKLDLSASLSSNIVKLNWLTKEEKDVTKYIVERSSDGQNFQSIGSVNSKGNGNFNYLVNDDINSATVSKYYYRLKVINQNGPFSYSRILTVNLKQTGKLLIGPNPFNEVIQVQYQSDSKKEIQLTLFNTAGQVLFRNKKLVLPGTNSFSIDALSHLPKGVYFIEIGDGIISRKEKLLKQ